MPKGIPANDKFETKDHLGNTFASVSDMCRHYGIPNSTYNNRIRRGWTVEQALTTANGDVKRKYGYKKLWYDHLGNEFRSVREMAEAWGITDKIYWSRKRICKWPLEKILTTPPCEYPTISKACEDHEGNRYPSVSEMCRHYGIKLSRFKERLKLGWDVKRALLAPTREMNDMTPKPCKDHKGIEYPSKNAMCRAYGISRYTLSSRLELGWPLEQALTGGYEINAKPCRDYLDREFPTLKDMANFYGIPKYRLQGLKQDAVESGLLPKLIEKYIPKLDLENIGIIRLIEFPYFLVRVDGAESVMHIEEILKAYHDSDAFEPIPKAKIEPAVKIIRRLGFPYYLIENNGTESVATYWTIIRLNAEGNFGLARKGANA